MTADEIVRAIEAEGGRASSKAIGTDNKTMEALVKAGVVKQDGTIKTGGRGRPSFAWVVKNADKAADVKLDEPKAKRDKSDMSAAHEGRRKAREQREKDDIKAREKELRELKASLPGLEPEYDKAIKLAVKATDPAEITKRFNRADQIQNNILGTAKRIKQLEAV